MIKNNGYRIAYFMLALVVFCFIYMHTPNLDYDTPGYINFDYTRPPIYPIFILLFRWAGAYHYSLIMWIQGIFLYATLLYVRFWLQKYLHIPDFPIFLVCLFVVTTIGFHFQIWYIESEGLAFPLFIFAFLLLVECFYQFNIKKIFLLSFIIAILVLTRLQFYYFYLMYALLCAWYLWQYLPIKQILISAITLFGSMFLTILIDHSYHYFKHGYFTNGSYIGIMLLAQTLYLADDNAASYFDDPVEKDLVKTMINQRNIGKLNQDSKIISLLNPSYLNLAYQVYARNYIDLQNMIHRTLKSNDDNLNMQSYKINTLADNINKVLLKHEFKRNSQFFLWKLVQCMGGISSFLFFAIILFVSGVKIIKDKIRHPNISLIFVICIALLTFFNATTIAICNPYLSIYFCYSQFMFYCLAAFLYSKYRRSFIAQHNNY